MAGNLVGLLPIKTGELSFIISLEVKLITDKDDNKLISTVPYALANSKSGNELLVSNLMHSRMNLFPSIFNI